MSAVLGRGDLGDLRVAWRARAPWRTARARVVGHLWLMAGVIIAVVDVGLWATAARVGFYWPVTGQDLDLYLTAAARWTGGGPFYPPLQLAGPFPVDGLPTGAQPILYPPTALMLFVPFLWLPRVAWWIVPLVATALVVVGLRPRPLAWIAIVGLALSPPSVMAVAAGNPGMWALATVAIATRWPVAAAWVALKPTLLPFMFFRGRHRSWVVGAGALAIISLAFTPMWLDYFVVLGNARADDGALYSLDQGLLLLIPIVAWLGSERRRTSSGPAPT